MKNQQDSFLIIQSRATKLGALTGFIGEVIGLLISYFLILSRTNQEESIYLSITFFTLICFPMPSILIGAVIGSIIGRMSIKRDNKTNHSKSFSYVKILGTIGIIGFTIGILPLVYFGISDWKQLTEISSPDWSADGTSIVFSSARAGNNEIYIMNSDGSELVQLTNSSDKKFSPAWSPDDSQIVFSSEDSIYNPQIYLIDANGGSLTKLTKNVVYAKAPSWSPNGKQIVFVANTENGEEIFVMNTNGTAPMQLTNLGGRNVSPSYGWRASPDWSPDSSHVVFNSWHDGNAEIYSMNSDGSNMVRLTNSTEDDLDPEWSPDGSQIAFIYGSEGNQQVFIMDSDGTHRTEITKNGGDKQDPSWSPDGSQIIFVSYSGFPKVPDIYTVNVNNSEITPITH